MGCCGSKQPAVSEEALAVDKDNNGLISREELTSYVEGNEKLYVMLSVSLNLPVKQCQQVATDVAFQMSKKVGMASANGNNNGGDDDDQQSLKDFSPDTRQRDPTIEEFQTFLDFLGHPKGQEEFFHRTVFATYDVNKSGYLEPDELDAFLEVFYHEGSIFAGDGRLPKKSKLKKEIMRQLDANGDGKLEFSELRTLISGGARAGLHFNDADDESSEMEIKESSSKKASKKSSKEEKTAK
eukprot:Nitzschia sp. Nitz4//scaffold26_size159584//110850//111569//NITZ4_002504-RA/size159584-processed-gene-0.201-mRNA-1//1//CDS//3329545121//2678//frame0